MIYKETFHAAKVAYVVNMVSSSYVQVSKEHIMSRIAGKTCKLHQTFQATQILLFQHQNRAAPPPKRDQNIKWKCETKHIIYWGKVMFSQEFVHRESKSLGGLRSGISVGVSVGGGAVQGVLCLGCVCLCPGGLCLLGSLLRGSLSKGEGLCLGGFCPGGTMSGGLCPKSLCSGGLCWGVSVQGQRSLSRGVSVFVQGDPRTVKSGRYASYWNAFLFTWSTYL